MAPRAAGQHSGSSSEVSEGFLSIPPDGLGISLSEAEQAGKAPEEMPAEFAPWGAARERAGATFANSNFLNRQIWELAVIYQLVLPNRNKLSPAQPGEGAFP